MTTELDMTKLEQSNQLYLNALVSDGQKARFVTNLFGKDYVWFEDPVSRTWYLERLQYAKTYSIDRQTGKVVPVNA